MKGKCSTPAVRRAAVLAGLLLALAGCGRQPAPAPQASASATAAAERTGPEAKPGVALTDARLVLPAVRGHPGAVYFTLANAGAAPVRVAAVHVRDAGKAELHETSGGTMRALGEVEVPANGSVRFAPGGRHVMVFDLADSLAAGGSTELTLTFSDGDKLSALVAIEAPGAGGMPGMDMAGH